MKIFTLGKGNSPSKEICVHGALWIDNMWKDKEGVALIPENNSDESLIEKILAEKTNKIKVSS